MCFSAMAFAAAWAWALQAGVIVTGVTPAPLDDLHSGERGMFATAPVAAATPLVTVPAAAVLTAPAARDAAPVWREAVAACHPRLPPPVELAAFLVWAAATPAAPFHHAYAASLPPTYTLALTFERADAELLGAPFAVEAAIAAGEAAAGDADAAAAVLARLGLSPPRSTLITALCAVRSRAMHHPGCSAGALLPLGDLFNHAPPRPPQPPDSGGACRACAGWHGASGACPSGGGDNDDPASSLPESWGDGAWDDDARVFRVTARTDYQPGASFFILWISDQLGRSRKLWLRGHPGQPLRPGARGGGHSGSSAAACSRHFRRLIFSRQRVALLAPPSRRPHRHRAPWI